ncbi:unnamed protein product [Amoebophrya sp. A120]|nr:unnamed protein product [Amoebophrya sp. A120]|eukprot:GSA120T00018391001.1
MVRSSSTSRAAGLLPVARDVAAAFTFPRTGLVARNRTVLAAMTNRQSFPDGTLSKEEVDFLVRRAQGGFGIVTTACAHVTRDGQGFPGELGVFDDKHLLGLGFLATELRKHGALSLVQIFHAGLQAPQHLTGEVPKSPSGPLQVGTHLSETGLSREFTESEVWDVIDAFATATRRVFDAGFDGVELHGAHGYLINQFLGAETNFRTDGFGGTRQNRFRFLFEIIAAIRRILPPPGAADFRPFLIGVRISPERNCGVLLEDSIELTKQLRDLQVDFIHLSCWDIRQTSSQETNSSKTLTEHFTSRIKDLPPVITTGRIWTHDDCLLGLQQGADLLGSARASIGNPDWAMEIVQQASAYQPKLPPYSEDHLKRQSLSDVFVYYMRRWRFVERDGKVLPFRE